MQRNIGKDHSVSILQLLPTHPPFLTTDSLNLLKYRRGQNSLTACCEVSQAAISGMAATRCLNLNSFCSVSTWLGNMFSTRNSIQQMRKSIIVGQPKYQLSGTHSFSYLSSQGSTFDFQYSIRQGLGSWWLVGRVSQTMPRMVLRGSCLERTVSIFILSSRVLPRRSLLCDFSIMQCSQADMPVTTKSPSITKGRSLRIQSLASVRENCLQSSGVKKRSRQGTCRYSQSRRQICALALTGQYPITTLPSFSTSIPRQPLKNNYYLTFLMGVIIGNHPQTSSDNLNTEDK